MISGCVGEFERQMALFFKMGRADKADAIKTKGSVSVLIIASC